MTDNITDNEIIKALECCVNEALDLINRQKAEIERLNIELQSMRSAANSYKMHYETAKSEAIKEFAERLKEKLQWDTEFENMIVFDTDIDNLLKEMTEVETNQRKEDEGK